MHHETTFDVKKLKSQRWRRWKLADDIEESVRTY